MKSTDVSARAEDASGVDDEFDEFDEFEELPSNRRLSLLTALLAVAVLLGVAFGSGVLIQKHHDASLTSTSTLGPPAGFTGGALGAGAPGAGGTGTGSTTGSGTGTSTATTPVVVGTVVSVNGSDITVKDLGGTTHVVHTSQTTTLTTTSTGSVAGIKAGRTVSIVGSKAADGSVKATSVTAR